MASKIVHMVPPTGKPRNPECQTGRLLSKAFWGLVVVCILWKWTSNVINPYKSGVCSLGVVWHFLNYIRWSKSQKNNENIDLQTKKKLKEDRLLHHGDLKGECFSPGNQTCSDIEPKIETPQERCSICCYANPCDRQTQVVRKRFELNADWYNGDLDEKRSQVLTNQIWLMSNAAPSLLWNSEYPLVRKNSPRIHIIQNIRESSRKYFLKRFTRRW